MDKKLSNDPRSVRARKAFQTALKDLLKVKPYHKITVTDIAKEAGFARHTFYNHYETKEALLNGMIDSILDKFFSNALNWNVSWAPAAADPETDLKVATKFFEIWQDHAEVVEILNTVDIDCLLIDRLKESFSKFLFDFSDQQGVPISPELTQYFISFNAYSFLGILRQWFRDGMKYPPEVMGKFLNHFAGIPLKRTAIEKFRNVIV